MPFLLGFLVSFSFTFGFGFGFRFNPSSGLGLGSGSGFGSGLHLGSGLNRNLKSGFKFQFFQGFLSLGGSAFAHAAVPHKKISPSCQEIFLKKETSSVFSTEESKRIFFQVLSEQSGWDLLQISALENKGTQKQKRELEKKLKKFSLEKEESLLKLREIVLKIHSIHHPEDSLYKSFRKGSFPWISYKIYLDEKIEKTFLRQSFSEAFYELGLVRDPTLWERFLLFRDRYSPYESLLIAGALNVVSIKSFGIPIYFPHVSWGNHQSIPSSLIHKIKTQGIDSVREDLRPLFRTVAHFQKAWDLMRRAYLSAMLGFAVVMTTEIYPVLKFSTQSFFF
jgi:hypothetical protein